MKKLKHFFFTCMLAGTSAASALHAQNTCNSATPITVGVPSDDSLAVQTQNWYYFVAASANPRVTVVQDNPTAGNVHSVLGYTGTCSNLQANGTPVRDTILPVDTLIFNFQNVALGDTCFFTVERQDPVGCRTCNFLPYAKYQVSVTNSSVVCFLVIDPPSQTICVGEFAVVTNNSFPSNPSDPCFPNYYWTMPGGNPSTFLGFQPPPIQYSSVGTYTVTLYEVDSQGNINYLNFVTATVIVEPQHTASFTYTPTTACALEDITFTYTGFNPQSVIPYLEWDFGDGNTIGCNPFACPYTTTHAYQTPGTYTVTVCAYYGSCDTTCASHVITIPDGNISFSYVSTCRVKFTGSNTCIGTIISETWNFGDNSPIVSGSNPTHTYAQNGVPYTVTYTVVSTTGTYTYTATVIQQGGPVANIQGFAVNSCGNGSINYTANPCVPGIVYSWVATGGTASNLTGCSTDVSWTNPNGGSLQLIAFDPIEDCSTSVTIIIPPCCFGTAAPSSVTYINNLTASQFIAAQNNNNVYSSTNQTIINGVFTVDADFTFLNCPDIWMGSNAVIIVQPGRTLTINNSKVIGKCQHMWDGIYIQDATATLNVINNSVIEQAKQAIVSINGGNFQVENSKLLNNLKGIVVQAHQGQHAGAIRGSTIAMPGTFLPAIPALPWWQTKTLVGIEIESNASITIGDASQPSYSNTFRHMFNAIWSKQSNTTVVNAKIARLSNHLNATNSGEGIVSEGGKQVSNPPYFYQLTVGGFGLNEAVTTDSTRIGIETRFTQRVYIYKNTIRNTRFYGIFIRANNAGTVQILNNGISNQTGYGFAMNTGIVVLDCYRAFVDISNNNLNQQNASVATQIGTGIRVGNVLPGIVYLNISNNAQIRRYQTGIWLQNLDGKNAVFVNYNNIQFSKAKSDYTVLHRGIRLENCISVRVDHNLVQRLGANWLTTEQNFASNLRGISVENSPGSLVYQNDCKRVGDGITGFGSCPASTFACNDLWRCYNGFNFFNADIGDQVIDPNTAQPAPTGNLYTSNVNRDLTGAISPAVNWYESVGINEQMQAGSLVPIAINDPQIISTATLCGTIYQIAPPPVTERSVEAGNVILSLQANNNILSPEQQHLNRKYVHRKLRQNPQWLTLGTPQDSIYQNFYIQADSTNLGLFRVVEENAIVENQPQVEAVNSSIACYGVMDHNLKVVTEIYSRTWMENIFEFSSNDSLMLYGIAILDPNIDGPGVYSARALLGLQVDDVTGNATFRLSDESDESAPLGAIHPNPAIETVSLATNLNQDEIGELEIYDINGRLIQNQGVSGAMELITLDVSSLDAGTYIVRLSVNGELRINERLVIVK